MADQGTSHLFTSAVPRLAAAHLYSPRSGTPTPRTRSGRHCGASPSNSRMHVGGTAAVRVPLPRKAVYETNLARLKVFILSAIPRTLRWLCNPWRAT